MTSAPPERAARRGAPRAFHLMSKPTGSVCNLDCEYCFFLSKEQLYPGSGFRMDARVHEAYVRGLLEAQAGLEEVVFAFQGGEPTLMGIDYFRRTVQLQRRHARPGQRVLNTLQTNGTLLDDDWGAFLREHDFLVGLSVDGPREMHDAFRVDKGGKPTYDRVLRGLDVLRRHGVEWNALTTMNAANGDHGREVYRFLRDDLGASFVQLIPVVERVTPELLPLADAGWGERAKDRPLYRQVGDRVTHRTITPGQLGRFLVDVFEDWARHDVGDVFVQVFDTALAHYVEPGYLLGNLADGRNLLDLLDSPQQVAFGQDKLTSLPDDCRRCDVRFACNGGCPKDRFAATATGQAGLHYLCAGYQTFFRHVDRPMRVMADLVRRGQDASGVMGWYAAHDARRAPGASCTCGSGRPWSSCHGSCPPRAMDLRRCGA